MTIKLGVPSLNRSQRRVESPRAEPTFEVASRNDQRDSSVDEIRGYALIAMIVTHVAGSTILYRLTHPTGPITAAAIFILLSGHVAGIRISRRDLTTQAGALSTSFILRAAKIWMIHIVLFLLYVGFHVTAGNVDVLNPFPSSPFWSLVRAMGLRWQPMYFDILPLYVVLLALMPVVIHFLKHGWYVALFGVSLSLWILAQLFPASGQSFSLPAWQLLFVLGLLTGVHRARILSARGTHFVFAITVLLATALAAMQLDGTAGQLLFAKESMGLGRLLHCLAFILVARTLLLTLRRHGIAIRLRAVLELLGRNSLFVFCAHLVLMLPLLILQVSEHSALIQILSMACMMGLILSMLWWKEQRTLPWPRFAMQAPLIAGHGGLSPCSPSDSSAGSMNDRDAASGRLAT